MKKAIAIFRTKGDILIARDMGNVQIADEVIQSPIFANAKMTDLLGFKAMSGSDYKIISVVDVKDNPTAFFNIAFGERDSGSTNS